MNVLNVPGFNQKRDDVLNELAAFIASERVNLLLPFATIIEAGNHIAHLPDGGRRRQSAEFFRAQVQDAIAGNAPWTPARSVDNSELSALLGRFPDSAMQKMGLGDLTILKEWEDACARHPNYRVRIWTLDVHLSGRDRHARQIY